MTQDFNKIQPIRFYIEDDKFINVNYFEKLKGNIGHELCLCPSDKLINFAFNVPTTINSITSCQLICPNTSTVKYEFKTRLKNASDLSLIGFINTLNGIAQYRVQYKSSDGFVVGANQDYIPSAIAFLRIVLTHSITGVTLTYRSDLLQIIGYNLISQYLIADDPLIDGIT